MTQPRNTRSVTDLFTGFDTTLRHYFSDRPRAYWHVLKSRFSNLPETNFKLGCEFAERGKWMDASFRFRFALYLQPAYTQAHYNLGCCYLQLGKRAKARDSFMKTLKLDPTHEDARFMLSGLAGSNMPASAMPRTMPSSMVVGFFTQVAPEYDALAERNGYQGPRLIAEACKPFLKATQGLHLIDIACGTGLVARPWRGLCREVLGMDITPAMVAAAQVARAGDNPVYERVLKDDITTLPAGTFMPGATDVVICCDSTQFIGDLAPLFKTAAAAMNAGGIFALTIEPYAAPYGFGVNPDTGRFGHTAEYVRGVAQAHGLSLAKDARVALYTELQAHLFVFAKPKAAA